jgi:hypothetical protein
MRATTTLLLVFLSSLVFAGAGKKQVKLIVQNNATGFSDETTVYLDYGTSSAYNFQEDAPKTFNPSNNVPQIYTLTSDSVACLINGYGAFVTAVQIGVGIKTDTSGVFSIFPSLLDNFDNASIIRLEDKVTGNFHDLRGNAYQFTSAQGQLIAGRFVLHISYAPIISTSDADCNNWGGSIEVVQDSSITWNSCNVYDSVGFLMASYPGVTGVFTFSYLPEGNYNVRFVYNDYIVYKQVYVKGHRIGVNITASTYYALVGQVIQLFSSVSNASYFMWSFSDGTIITGVTNPDISFYSPGVYTVILKCSNANGCEASDTIIITIAEPTGITEEEENSISVFSQRGSISITSLPAESSYRWQVVNLLGAVVSEGATSGTSQIISLANQPKGIYLVTLSKQGMRLTKKVTLQ